MPTGWPRLDRVLGGGWPLGQLTELLIDGHGLGELTLLLPAFRRLAGREEPVKWLALVSPPYMPYAPALTGLDLARVLVIHSRRDMDTLWAMEQALHSKTCTAVIGWSQSADGAPLRRLQLAAEMSGSWTVLFRPSHLRSSRSPAPLRVHLAWEPVRRRLVAAVLKRRSGPPAMAGLDVGR